MASAIDFDFYKFYDRTKTNPYETAMKICPHECYASGACPFDKTQQSIIPCAEKLPYITIYYNITNTASTTPILYIAPTNFTGMKVNGNHTQNVTTTYKFPTTGINKVIYFMSETTTIQDNTFKNITSLITTEPLEASIIGQDAFQRTGLTAITLPNVTLIKGSFFSTPLVKIDIGDKLETMGRSSFEGCRNTLRTFVIRTKIPPTVDAYGLHKLYETQFYVPSESLNRYKTAPGWDVFKNQMHTLEEIPEG